MRVNTTYQIEILKESIIFIVYTGSVRVWLMNVHILAPPNITHLPLSSVEFRIPALSLGH